MFDQNATIKEEEELDGQEDDHSDVVNIQPGNYQVSLHFLLLYVLKFLLLM